MLGEFHKGPWREVGLYNDELARASFELSKLGCETDFGVCHVAQKKAGPLRQAQAPAGMTIHDVRLLHRLGAL